MALLGQMNSSKVKFLGGGSEVHLSLDDQSTAPMGSNRSGWNCSGSIVACLSSSFSILHACMLVDCMHV